jgi:cation transport regulator ChaC
MIKQSCVIAITHIGDKKWVFKNRDRNYIPDIRVHHIISDNGVEILYFKDERTGWVEGINEHGIVVSNAALMVLEDEKEGTKKKSKAIRFSQDAHRIISALECTSLLQALHILTHLKTGVKGHTMISDERHAFVIEQTSKHDAKVDEILEKNFVRTNHGIYYSDAGYVSGDDRESSETRYETMMGVLESKPKKSEDIIKKLFALRLKDVPNPNNVVRKVPDGMFTSNQFLFDAKTRTMTMYLVDQDSEFVGYEKHFKKPSRCKLEVKRVTSNKENKVVIEEIEVKEEVVEAPPPNEKVFRVFAYGTLMSEPEHEDLITNSWKGHINSISRSFNVMSENRHGHLIIGTKPGGSMQGLVLEYPVESLEKVLKTLDEREGYKHDRSNEENTYIRRVMRVYSDKNAPYGVLCVVYLTNEESKKYTGEWDHPALLKELSKNHEDDRVVKYLRNLRNALINETCDDAYVTKIREDLIKHYKIRV